MVKIIKFPADKKLRYSEKFLKKVDPNKIGDFIAKENPDLSIRAADAMALAIIYSTYLSLVFEEEGEQPVPFDDIEHYIWAAHDKKTLH